MSSKNLDVPEVKLNGFHSNHTPNKEVSHWRETAMNHAIRVRSREGDAGEALLAEIRAHRRGTITLTQWLDTNRVLEFLAEEAEENRSLLSGADFCRDFSAQDLRRHNGWFAVRWKGAEVELVISPTSGSSTDIIILAENDETAKSLSDALAEFALRPKGRCLRYSGYWESAPEIEDSIRGAKWDDVILAPEITQGVREAVDGFVAGKGAYAALGFSWRRGILLVGPPGTGKTMLCKAVAASLTGWPLLYVRSLRDHGQQDSIRDVFTRARKLAPCLLVFEDIDGMIGEDNRTVLLNEMDGFRSNEGLLIVASSNHPGKIDEALLKRPSRFDRVFHVGLPKKPERKAYCLHLLTRSELASHLTSELNIEELADKVAAGSDGFTPAFIKEAITAAALSRAQSGAMSLDAEFGAAVIREVATLKQQMKRSRDPEGMAIISGGADNLGLRRRD